MSTETPQPPHSPPDPPLTGAQKSAATALRNRQAVRAEKLADIQSQIEEGTLVVRHLS
ncbi:MAG TPA: hypothetical protein VFN55_16365 [Solirubrobacteraceae bacterium]|nr:hypothetical protein [Solirubrobacteraceae bacterium]